MMLYTAKRLYLIFHLAKDNDPTGRSMRALAFGNLTAPENSSVYDIE